MHSDAPKINDTISSMQEVRDKIVELLESANEKLVDLRNLYVQHSLYFSDVPNNMEKTTSEGDEAVFDYAKIMVAVDQKFWERAITLSGVERVITSEEKEKLKKKYIWNEKCPEFTEVAAREMLQVIGDSTGDLAMSLVKQIFLKIVDSGYRPGGHWRKERRTPNKKRIEKTFRFGMFFGGYPERFVTDEQVAFINDVEAACALVSSSPHIEYPNRIGDKVKDGVYKNEMMIVGTYFSLRFFKNGNVVLEFSSDEVVGALNRFGAPGNVLA